MKLPTKRERALAMLAAGVSESDVSKAVGYHLQTIRLWIKEAAAKPQNKRK